MNRREFFGIVIGAYFSKFYTPKSIPGTWGAVVRSKFPLWRPHPAQVEFFNRPLDEKILLWRGR